MYNMSMCCYDAVLLFDGTEEGLGLTVEVGPILSQSDTGWLSLIGW